MPLSGEPPSTPQTIIYPMHVKQDKTRLCRLAVIEMLGPIIHKNDDRYIQVLPFFQDLVRILGSKEAEQKKIQEVKYNLNIINRIISPYVLKIPMNRGAISEQSIVIYDGVNKRFDPNQIEVYISAFFKPVGKNDVFTSVKGLGTYLEKNTLKTGKNYLLDLHTRNGRVWERVGTVKDTKNKIFDGVQHIHLKLTDEQVSYLETKLQNTLDKIDVDEVLGIRRELSFDSYMILNNVKYQPGFYPKPQHPLQNKYNLLTVKNMFEEIPKGPFKQYTFAAVATIGVEQDDKKEYSHVVVLYRAKGNDEWIVYDAEKEKEMSLEEYANSERDRSLLGVMFICSYGKVYPPPPQFINTPFIKYKQRTAFDLDTMRETVKTLFTPP